MDIWYIKLHRKILEWEWYGDSNVTRVFLHFLLIANREEKKWRGVTIPKWSLVTGRLQLSETLWLSERQIRTALTKLKTTNEIAIQTTNYFSVIEVKNWQMYQDQKTSKTTNERPTRDQRTTTPKEVKNIEVKNIDTTETPLETKKDFFSTELERVSDTWLKIALTEWWHYKKGKYQELWWHKQVTICLGYPADIVIKRIDTAIASGWMGLNLEHLPKTQPTSSLTLADL